MKKKIITFSLIVILMSVIVGLIGEITISNASEIEPRTSENSNSEIQPRTSQSSNSKIQPRTGEDSNSKIQPRTDDDGIMPISEDSELYGYTVPENTVEGLKEDLNNIGKTEQKDNRGPIVGGIIIITVVIIVGLLVWFYKTNY